MFTVSLNGVAFFPSQDLTPRDLEVLALALGRASDAPRDGELHIHPTAELGENGQPKVGKISNGELRVLSRVCCTRADSNYPSFLTVASKDGRAITFKDERSDLAR